MSAFMIPNKHYCAFTAFLLLMGHDPVKIEEEILHKEWLNYCEIKRQAGEE